MIVNLYGTAIDGKIMMEIPNIILDRKLKFKVAVHRIHFLVSPESKHNCVNNELLLLRSNLIDRSSANPHQAIVYFNYNKSTNNRQSNKADPIIFHSIHLYEIQNASFEVCRFTGESTNFKFKEIFIQLEINRSETYGWL